MKKHAGWLAFRVAAAAGLLRPAAASAYVQSSAGQTGGAALGGPEHRGRGLHPGGVRDAAAPTSIAAPGSSPARACARAGPASQSQLADAGDHQHLAGRHRPAFHLPAAHRHQHPWRPAGRADAMHPAGRRLAARRHGGAGQGACLVRRRRAAGATVMERSIGVQSGMMRADAAPPARRADALLAERLAARAFGSGDIGAFDQLWRPAPAPIWPTTPAAPKRPSGRPWRCSEGARAGTIPNTATALMTLALQLSDDGRLPEARHCSPRPPSGAAAADPTAVARLRIIAGWTR